MTRQQIIERVHKLKSKMDLLNLLNDLKREDLGKDCHRFNLKQLNFYSNPNFNPAKRYKNFTIPKKSGGVRKISSPRGSLKFMLTYLNVIFQAMYEPTDAAMGFVPGRSIADNAAKHVGKKYVFNTDLKDFFPSVRQARIWKILQIKPFSLNIELASVIAGLCCIQHPQKKTDRKGKIIGVLPQGSPCSPILTNIVCRNLDRRLQGLAKRFNLIYTRYADDITFSSDYNVFQVESEFMTEFTRIVIDEEFEINDKKTRLQKVGQRQEVTGLVVNNKVNIAREYYRDIRSLLYIWKRYGKEQAYAKFFSRYITSNTYKAGKNQMPSMQDVISGKLLYMKMVMGEDSSTYVNIKNKYLALCPEHKVFLETNLSYIVSYRLNEFESVFNTKVEFAYKSEKFQDRKGRSKTTGTFILDEVKHFVSVNIRCDKAIGKYLLNPDGKALEALKRRFYISLAERGNVRFWLITLARMSNEHSKSFKGSYKAKFNEEYESYYFDIAPTDEQKNINDATISYSSFEDFGELDECLSELVSSGFDLKTLEKWDKIKKN